MVRVMAIREDRFAGGPLFFVRRPLVGDVGTIVMDHGDAFDVECSAEGTGITLWLEAMYPDELEPS